MATLFVSNLSWSSTEDDLLSMFSKFGVVTKTSIAKDRDTGRSKGFAFIDFVNDSEAKTACDSLDRTAFDGRLIRVTISEQKKYSEKVVTPAIRYDGWIDVSSYVEDRYSEKKRYKERRY